MKTISAVAAVLSTVALAMFASGCSSADTTASSSNQDLSADTSSTELTGTFEAVGDNVFKIPYATYTFHGDHTFEATGGCALTANCHAISSASGTYSVKNTTPEKTITLVDQLGNTDTYILTVGGNTLTFNKTADGPTAYFFKEGWTKSIPFMDVCEDNEGNSLGTCSDSGNFGCGDSGITDGVKVCSPLD